MDAKMKFIGRCLQGDLPMTALCIESGISREVGYKWLRRYHQEGVTGLEEHSRAPKTTPHAIDEQIVSLFVELRERRPTWGPRKLLAALRLKHPALELPAASTVGDLLKRHGLVEARSRRRRAAPSPSNRIDPKGPNACWSTDFKGQFRLGDRNFCYPLTLLDGYSRYLLRCHALSTPSDELARPVFDAAFREFGLPERMRSDNGSPFASASLTGLTKLSAWWVKLGIRLERIVPGHPEQNGRHERMHRTLKAEATRPASRTSSGQQRTFDVFTRAYNEERPHEALDNKPPAAVYHASPRSYSGKLVEPDYAAHWDVRRVDITGRVTFHGYRVRIASALQGEPLAFEPIEDGLFHIHFFAMRLGSFDLRDARLRCPGGERECERYEIVG
jgi:transposase InsO family protein